jgi:hypothetical protein
MRIPGLTAAIVALALGSSAAIAHHSAAPFNFGEPVVVEGIVKEIRVVNPHTFIVLEQTDDARGTRDVEYEGMSASIFYRAGYTTDSVAIGDTIQIRIAPRFDGEDGGFITAFTTADGREIGFQGF